MSGGEGLGGDARRRVSIIIVAYRSREDIDDAIASGLAAARSAGLDAEIIVVDNDSPDGTADHVAARWPQVSLLRSERNEGFGAANNRAFAIASGATWLLLNPDARLAPDALRHLVGFLEAHPRAGAVAPAIAGPGSAESAGMLPSVRSVAAQYLFLNRILPRPQGRWRGFQLPRQRASGAVRVEWVSGAAVALRPQAVRDVGGFDARIFLYGEDLDLCDRLGRSGWEVWLLPRARAHHRIGGSSETPGTRWLDGIDEQLQRMGRARPARLAVQGMIGLGLALRVVLGARLDASHRRRLRAGARGAASRALRLLRRDA